MAGTRFGHYGDFLCVVFISTVALLARCHAQACTKISSCSCECSGGKIDLNDLASSSGPKFLDVQASDDYSYSYNPCTPFTESYTPLIQDNCQNVAACQAIELGTIWQFYDIGTQESVTFTEAKSTDYGLSGDDIIVMKYVAADLGRQTEVVLQCADDTTFSISGEIPGSMPATYRFILASPSACYVGISAGSVLLIIFVCVLFMYLVAGLLFNKFRKHKSGKELIPNYEFWKGFPRAVKDGCLFVLKRGAYRPASYDNV